MTFRGTGLSKDTRRDIEETLRYMEGALGELATKIDAALPEECREVFDQWRDGFRMSFKHNDPRARQYAQEAFEMLVAALLRSGAKGV